jgi:hypothetical protein
MLQNHDTCRSVCLFLFFIFHFYDVKNWSKLVKFTVEKKFPKISQFLCPKMGRIFQKKKTLACNFHLF